MATVESGIDIQPRDLQILRGLFESRVMTASQIADIYFEGKRPYTKKRLQKIKKAGLIAERSRKLNEPSIHFLTQKGFLALKNRGELIGFPELGKNSFEARTRVSDLTIRHELQVMEVKAAIYRAITGAKHLKMVEFTTWPLLNRFVVPSRTSGADCIVQPDGFIRIYENESGTPGWLRDFFLEVDRSTENQDILVNRIRLYHEYYRSGGYAAANGVTPEKFGEFPFRVLVVLKNAERENNLAERLIAADPPILRQAWLTTFTEVTEDPLGPIWIVPANYRETVRGSRFQERRTYAPFEYRRDSEREKFIEATIQKLSLLND